MITRGIELRVRLNDISEGGGVIMQTDSLRLHLLAIFGSAEQPAADPSVRSGWVDILGGPVLGSIGFPTLRIEARAVMINEPEADREE